MTAHLAHTVIDTEPVKQQRWEERCLENGVEDAGNPAVHEECQRKHWIYISRYAQHHYRHCAHSRHSRVYETAQWLSVCLSQYVPTAANPLLQVCCCGPGVQEWSTAAAVACRKWMQAVSCCQCTEVAENRDDGVLGCSGIRWTICKQSERRSRQITTLTPHHSTFYRPDALLNAHL